MKYIAVYFGGAHFSGAATQYQDFFTGFITDPIETNFVGTAVSLAHVSSLF